MWVGEITCLRHPSKPDYVCRGGKSTGQLLSLTHRGGPWRLHIQPATPIWLVLWSWSSQECSEGLEGSFFFPVRFLRLREKIFWRSRHLIDSIWRSICLWAKSVETGDRHCAYVTKSNIDFLLGEPSRYRWDIWHIWHIWHIWSSWSSWPSWHRSEAEVKKETPGTMHYIYVALKQPKKIDALPCGYPPRPSR